MIEDIYDESPIQAGLHFHMLLDPRSGVYVEQLAFTLAGPLDLPAFRRAWQLAVRRHPILRTSFHWREVGKPLQTVHSDATVEMPVLDWRSVSRDELENRFAARAAADRVRGFDLTRPPVMRTKLLRLGDHLHRFYWTFPHILLDGWSFGLVFGEVAAAYEAFAGGHQPEFPPARPYRDYIAWLQRRDHGSDLAFWRGYLDGCQPAPAFQVGAALPPVPDGEPSHGVVLDDGLREPVPRLRELARSNGLTLNTVMQGAWAVLLSRYLDTRDVVAGSTASHRPADLAGADAIVGPMLSTTPVRARVDPAAQVLPWLRRLQESMAEARAAGPVSVPELRSGGALSGHAQLFDTDVAFENVPVPDLRLHGLDITDTWYDGRPHYAVTMILVPGEGLVPRVVYDRRRLSAVAAGRLAVHFRTILDAIASGAAGTLGELEMIPPAERAVLLGRDAPVAAPLPSARRLNDIFAETAANHPAETAVSCRDQSLTYAELDARASQLARRLREAGAGPSRRVGLCLDRSLDTVVAILGVLKSGAAYVPMEPDQPAARLRYIVADAQVSILVTNRTDVTARLEFGGPVISLDGASPAAQPPSGQEPGAQAGPDDLAYIIYTSGSTGRPKGVMVTHANVASLLAGAAERFSLSAADTWSMCHSYAFDVSVFEMWGAFAHGGRLVVVPGETVRSPEELCGLLRRERVTVFSQTPSAFRQFMLAALADGDIGPSALRYVVFAGEYLDVQALRPWLDRHGDTAPELINMYGITETTVHSTFARLTKQDLDSPVRSRVGHPLPHVRMYLLDSRGEPVPAGVPGEIYVSGPSVARGYQGLEELTEERFRPDPFAGSPGTRMYRSGDLARRLEDGQLEILGRIDGQLKVRGYRVEPGEIEAVLRDDPAVRDVVVVPAGDGTAGDGTASERLFGYVVTDDRDPAPLIARLHERARSQLPYYMVPARLIPLDRLPLTANGKLDRSRLPAPGSERPAAGADFVAPRTPLEERVAAVWREALGVDRIGIHDDFFALGGHSLLAVRVVFLIRAELGTEVPVRTIFSHPTVAGFAGHLPAEPAALPIPRRARVAYQPQGSSTE